MGRLIDENSVIENAEKCAFTDKDDRRRFLEFVKYCVKEAPTAYDIEKVVEQLEDLEEDFCQCFRKCEEQCFIQRVTDIVRKGGVE